MYSSSPHKLDEFIIDSLAAGPTKTTVLLERVRELHPASKQGFYAALRRLKAANTIVLARKEVSLNTTWIQKMRDTIARMEHTYALREEHEVLRLRDKESISYVFSSLRQLDNFWGHIQNIVIRALPPHAAVFTYDPHYWFYVGRRDTERALIKEVERSGKQFLMTVAGKTPLDVAIKGDFDTDTRQYHMEKFFDDESLYMVVIGDYIFESHFAPEVSKYIEDVYAVHIALTSDAIRALDSIQELRARFRLRISRNRVRAKKLRTKLAKNFYVRPNGE